MNNKEDVGVEVLGKCFRYHMCSAQSLTSQQLKSQDQGRIFPPKCFDDVEQPLEFGATAPAYVPSDNDRAGGLVIFLVPAMRLCPCSSLDIFVAFVLLVPGCAHSMVH